MMSISKSYNVVPGLKVDSLSEQVKRAVCKQKHISNMKSSLYDIMFDGLK